MSNLNDLRICGPAIEEIALSLFSRKWGSIASLVLVVWDYGLTLGDEASYIWRRPFNTVKATYLFSRYVGLVVQAINLYFVLGPLFTGIPIEDQRICRRWFGSLLAVASSLLQCLAFVLLLRIYALYEQERRIAFILVGLFMTLLIGQAIMGPLVITNVSFNCICDTTNIYPPVVFVCIIVWVVHLAIGALLLGKRGLHSLGIRVVKIVNRDGALILGLVCAIFAFLVPYSTVRGSYQAHVVMTFPMALVSVACCRAVLNLLTINADEAAQEHSNETFVLTVPSLTSGNTSMS
ncbi:hypothetical protein BJ165DRAFT_1482378 [Panaeolus papilionaceus]|nr:hypothetical protein BJ165DRAFT_1482378 [Panaeolus papilionaceus]